MSKHLITKQFKNRPVANNDLVQFTAGILINKLDRDTLRAFQNKLKKYFTKKIHAYNFQCKEVNTFLFMSASFNEEHVNTKEKRLTLENGLRDIVIDYNIREKSLFTKQIRKNIEIKDISQILISLILDSSIKDKDHLVEEIKNRANEIENRSVMHLTNVMVDTFVIFWEFPIGKENIVVLPNHHFHTSSSSAINVFQLQTLIENLTIYQFAAVLFNNLSWVIGSFEYAIDSLREEIKRLLERYKSNKEVNNSFMRAMRVMFGLLSSTQQILSDLIKEINRITIIKEELKDQIKALKFDELMELFEIYNVDLESDDYIVWLNQLSQDVRLVYRNILTLINKAKITSQECQMSNVGNIISIFNWAFADIQTMKFFAEQFRDITFFQPIPPDVSVEKEKEIDMDKDSVIKGISLFKTYRLFGSTVYALRGTNLEVKKGEMVAILGPSGSGKTTLLNLLAGLDTPDNGGVFYTGKNINMLSDNDLSLYRRREMGFIFQYYNLIPQLTVLENVMLPGLMIGRKPRQLRKKAIELLKEVGIEQFKDQFPAKLSGGQMQRVTIARSMINDPLLLFADEPTGDLDSQTGTIVVDLIHRFAKEKGTAVIFVTHDKTMAERCDRIVQMRDGKIVEGEN